jgi:hypothetical protein
MKRVQLLRNKSNHFFCTDDVVWHWDIVESGAAHADAVALDRPGQVQY